MSLIHWIILGGILLLVFGGRGKISDVMGDVAKGIKSFKKGLSEDDDAPKPVVRPVESVRTLDHYPQTQTHVQPTQAQPVMAQTPPAQDEARVVEPRKVG